MTDTCAGMVYACGAVTDTCPGMVCGAVTDTCAGMVCGAVADTCTGMVYACGVVVGMVYSFLLATVAGPVVGGEDAGRGSVRLEKGVLTCSRRLGNFFVILFNTRENFRPPGLFLSYQAIMFGAAQCLGLRP